MIRSDHEWIDSGGKHFNICCQFYLINNKNSAVNKLGTCVVNVLWQLEVKYYIVKVFIVECNLSIKLKSNSFWDMCLCLLFCLFWWEEHSIFKFVNHFRHVLCSESRVTLRTCECKPSVIVARVERKLEVFIQYSKTTPCHISWKFIMLFSNFYILRDKESDIAKAIGIYSNFLCVCAEATDSVCSFWMFW